MLAQMVQHDVDVEDAGTLMPPFLTDEELMLEWHLMTNEEVEESAESCLNDVLKETIEGLIRSVEKEAWAEASKVFEEAKDERKVMSAKTYDI